jgi:hypothetical protein
MRGKESLIRTYGIGEIVSGVLSLLIDKQAGLWSRVAGDGLDIATLVAGLREDNPKQQNVGIALAGAWSDVPRYRWRASTYAPARQKPDHPRGRRHFRDYSDRSGFPKSVSQARGLLRKREDGLSE